MVTNCLLILKVVSDNSELSNAFVITNYKKLSSTSNMVGKVSFFGKTITGLSDDVRISKRANIPYNRLRGFEKGRVGPIDNNDYVGGNHVTTLNLSATLPNILEDLDNLDIGIFFDAANIWGIDYDNSLDDGSKIRTSLSLGVDWFTAIGPLNFSLSETFSKTESDVTESFRFNIGCLLYTSPSPRD